MYTLMAHQDFDRMLSKHLPANTLRNVQEIVEGLKTKVRDHYCSIVFKKRSLLQHYIHVPVLYFITNSCVLVLENVVLFFKSTVFRVLGKCPMKRRRLEEEEAQLVGPAQQ